MHEDKTQNLEMCRTARREMSRHPLDCSEVEVSASHGVLYLHGRVRPLRGAEANFEHAIAAMLKGLRERHGVRDVITEWRSV